ncbi:putative transcription factor C3H family [Helianthus annuus]|nr:zinc finger CCCH domain-containing protein 68 [Helianthus annuus]XP_022015816.1 zinc finger CCCH domain-containing protein 68 [Helianthus annuus]KAJ0440145.1 putative transcription factor C3H family [Helianthus annuus]KAJ0642927.1 putative transcription factor C3H family [Helianthus annuus]KAJ0646791.1 putative transcription factor C3H family [Helianthus annuus]
MLGKRGSELRTRCEHPPKHHFRTSWVQPIKTHIHHVPQIAWTCPPRFLVDPNWKMEAGSESQEKHIQLHRESRIAEAIYYHKSAIPPNPYVAPNTLDFNDGSRIPVIPLDVINDETSPNDPLIPPGPTAKPGEKTTQPLLPRDEVIGTAIALVALIKSKEPGSQVDLELLIQLLCNPGMLENLTKEHGLETNQSSVITRAQPHEHSSVPVPAVGGYSTCSPSAPFSRSLPRDVRNMIEQIHSNSESQNPSSNKKVDVGKLRKLINEYGLGDDSVKRGPAAVKDAGYYRRLISLHGMAQENDKPQGSVKLTGSREQRPCVFFNGPNGCRNGSGCRFQHVKGGVGGGGQEQHGEKRMKFSGGIFGRHT